MISEFKIIVEKEHIIKDVVLICDSEKMSITLCLDGLSPKTYTGKNFYHCFGLIRKDNPLVTFFCKGSKLNVHPSSLSSQMSLGLKAYELTNGAEPSLKDVVSIFDYENENLTNSPELQREFFLQWIGS